MASTEKVSLSLDADALMLGRRAAAIEGVSLSAYVSGMLRRHVWDSEPVTSPEVEGAAARDAELDLRELALWEGEGHQRAAG